MTGLLGRCAADDPEAWSELWGIVASSIRGPTLRRLAASGRDAGHADDVAQEFYLHLRADSCRRLREFRGTGEPEFRSYIRASAANFVRSHLAGRRRADDRECGAGLAAARPEAEGATEPQVLAALREFAAALAEADRPRLRALIGPEGGAEAARACPRTLRRWRRELAAIYAERVL